MADVVLEDAVALGAHVALGGEMSVTRPPRRAAAMPRHMACSVTRISSRSRSHGAHRHRDRGVTVPAVDDRPAVDGDDVPIGQDPSSGMPCTTSSSTEVQIDPGKPW